jgi:hypothetical protein
MQPLDLRMQLVDLRMQLVASLGKLGALCDALTGIIGK